MTRTTNATRAVALALLLCIALVLNAGARGTGETAGSLIVFSRYTDGGFGLDARSALYVVRPDGSGLRQLTKLQVDGADDGRLAPDHSTIAFVGDLGASSYNCALIPIRVGARPHLLTDKCYSQLAWSPNGKRLAFTFQHHGIATIARDGSGLHVVPGTSAADASATAVDWSPEGQVIAFDQVSATYEGSIWIVRPDGTGLRQIADGSGPRFSPDGRSLLYYAYSSDGFDVVGLRSVQLDGSGDQQLASGSITEFAWSPDGHTIVYEGPQGRLCLLDLTTNTTRLLPLPPKLCSRPFWCGSLDWR